MRGVRQQVAVLLSDDAKRLARAATAKRPGSPDSAFDIGPAGASARSFEGLMTSPWKVHLRPNNPLNPHIVCFVVSKLQPCQCALAHLCVRIGTHYLFFGVVPSMRDPGPVLPCAHGQQLCHKARRLFATSAMP